MRINSNMSFFATVALFTWLLNMAEDASSRSADMTTSPLRAFNSSVSELWMTRSSLLKRITCGAQKTKEH